MKDSHLVYILKSFSPGEIKELDKAVASPLFNSQQTVTNFYKQVRRFYPDFKSKYFEKEKIFANLYPGKKFSGQRIRGLSSELKKIIDDYLLYKSAKNNPVKSSFIKIEDLFDRGLVKEVEKELKLVNKNLESNRGVYEPYLRDKYYYENLNVQYFLRTEQQQLVSGSVQEGFSYFFYHFFMRLAYFLHDVTVNKIIFNNKASNNLIEKITRSIDYKGLHEFLMNEIDVTKYYRIVDLYVLIIINNLDPQDLTYYEQLMRAVSESIDEFDKHEKYNIYQILEAICWHKMSTHNNLRYREELFRINKMRLADGVFSPDGKTMRMMLYRQILMTAVYLKEYKWVEEFVEEYSQKLPGDHIENMQNFSFAHILYEKGDHDKALEALNKVDFDIFTFKFDTRNLLLKIYYDLDYVEEAFSLIDSYRHFISENKAVSEYYRNLSLDFIHHYGWLLKIKSANDISELSNFTDSINRKPVYFSNWLLEKAKELEKN